MSTPDLKLMIVDDRQDPAKTAGGLEDALLKLLIDVSLPESAPVCDVLYGPVADGANRTDVVTTQAQVDDLLESLGF